MTLRALCIAATAALAATPAAMSLPPAQDDRAGEVWDELAVRAASIMACRAAGHDSVGDPSATALQLYAAALAALDASRSANPVVIRTRGAARAGIIRKQVELSAKQKAWQSSLDQAMRLVSGHTPDRGASLLAKAAPPPCWDAFRRVSGTVEQERRTALNALAAGDRDFSAAQASFELAAGAAKAANASAQFKLAHDLNQDLSQALKRAAEAGRLAASLSVPLASNEIVFFSNPGGAAVTLHGPSGIHGCPATPCRLRFASAYFDPSGGGFLYTKRLLAPVTADVSKPGFLSETLPVTEGPREWSGNMPGGRRSFSYYFFNVKHFEARLTPAPSR